MPVPTLQDVLDLLRKNEVDTAIEVLEQTVDEIPAHLTAHMVLARAYEANQQWSRALQSWENARFLLPNSPVVQEGKRRVLRRLNGAEPPSEAAESSAPAAAPESDDASDSEDDPSSASSSETPSELEALRRETEKRARQGGARAGLADDVSSAKDTPTPEEHLEQLEGDASDYELDRLIQDLESARIEPDPDMEDAPAPELDDDVDDLVSETLAQIHAAQNQYAEAARIYEKLASQEPDRSQEHLQKVEEMRENAEAADKED